MELTCPVKSGMSLSLYCDLGGNDWLSIPMGMAGV
jgi:hypothetical protein